MNKKAVRFRITLIFRIRQTIVVTATTATEAKTLALEQAEVPHDAEHYDTLYKVLR